jgi:Na+/H+ antiporter NhaD/arsenite permease-like protein
MLIVVQTLNRQWLGSIDWTYPGGHIAAIAVAIGIAALGSNVVNNVPMALLAMPFVERNHVKSLPTPRSSAITSDLP